MSDPITIRRLMERISSGDIRIPAFQRDFVWEPDQVAFLLDSIYKGFPIGTVILWKTDNRLKTEKTLGRYQLPEPRKDYPVNYVLDGQQRITSLFSVFQSELDPQEDSSWVDIYFDLQAEESVQESVFIPLAEDEVDLERHFPVNVLFDALSYRKATKAFEDPDTINRLDALLDRFREYLVLNQIFESDDRNAVAIVFERINRAGTPLDIFQLLSAWSWSETFDLVDSFRELQDEIADAGYEDLCRDKDLQLRVCAGVIRGETTPSTILGLTGEEIRAQFPQVRRGLIGAIDFLRRELGVANFKLLPFPGMLVPLSVYFATDKIEGIKYSDNQKSQIEKWFWRSAFSRRFSASVNARQAQDIKELLALKKDPDYQMRLPAADIRISFDTTRFSANTANSKTLILMLASSAPFSLVSGAKIELGKVLQATNRNEFHHIFPQKHLEKLGVQRNEINVLANICFLTRGDNNAISDKSPSDYVDKIPITRKDDYLNRALIPHDFSSTDYSVFVINRSKLLIQKAEELMA